ncbi:MAG: GNAT family N-acetyltransferase [Chloroflexota bacterium]
MPPVENPILLDIPEQFTTERCVVRAPRSGDGPATTAAIYESLDLLRPWMSWAVKTPELDWVEHGIRYSAAQFLLREDLRMQIFHRASGQYLGGTGLHQIDWKVPTMEIGYWLRASAQGQGYMTEVVNALTDYAFRYCHAERIEIRMDTRNFPSQTVAQRCGYVLEATLRAEARNAYDDTVRDMYLYAKVRTDWAA